jgi:DNA-binding GntR family transcriptional regulator
MIDQSSSIQSSGAVLSAIDKSAAPLRRQVLDELRQSIIAGRLAPGARLVERELTAMMGVSRTVVREALRQLESEGLISIIPNKGPVVRELTLEEAKDIYSIRAVLEGLAARRFVENASDNQIEKLQQALNATAEAYQGTDPALVMEAKNRFYDELFEGAGSETLSSLISIVHGRIWRWRALGLSHPHRSAERSNESVTGLRAVLDAIRGRDASLAEQRMRDEVTRAASEVMRLIADSNMRNS